MGNYDSPSWRVNNVKTPVSNCEAIQLLNFNLQIPVPPNPSYHSARATVSARFRGGHRKSANGGTIHTPGTYPRGFKVSPLPAYFGMSKQLSDRLINSR